MAHCSFKSAPHDTGNAPRFVWGCSLLCSAHWNAALEAWARRSESQSIDITDATAIAEMTAVMRRLAEPTSRVTMEERRKENLHRVGSYLARYLELAKDR